MKAFFFYGLIPIILGSISLALHPNAASWTAPEAAEGEVLIQDVQAWDATILWVDARSSKAFEQAHVPDAVSLNDENFEANLSLLLNQWQPGDRVLVYCDTQLCDASHAMAERLKDEVGLEEVWILFGGWKAWKDLN